MVENELTNEIVLNVPLRAAKRSSSTRRADTAIEILKEYVSRNTKEMSCTWAIGLLTPLFAITSR